MAVTLGRRVRAGLALAATLATGALSGCDDAAKTGALAEGIQALGEAPALAKASGSDPAAGDPDTIPKEGGPKLGAITMSAPIHQEADRRSPKIGYLRAGGTLTRGDEPVKTDDCEGGWYRVLPLGFVCASVEATTDLSHPIIRALTLRPDVSKPMPYPYAFVRAIAPNYYRVPTVKEQEQYEMALDRHLKSYKRLHAKWDALSVGANDIELDAVGNAIGFAPDEPPPLDYNAIYGGNGSDAIPWYFDGGRKLPNISSFKAPDYAVITNRVKRKAMLALIGTFVGPGERRFAMTTDARLVPTSKLKPDRGTTFHGVSLESGWHLPMAFVKLEGTYGYDVSKASLERKEKTARLEAIQLTGRSKHLGGHRLLEAKGDLWYRERDIAVVPKPGKLPSFAKDDQKWVDISIHGQTLVLYQGKKPVYATAISTGRDGLGDPGKTLSTPTGVFEIRDKHVTTTMDANEVDNQFELRDVPWVQYFKGGYAIHAAPWHDEYGKPRSHGCINMSPIDARRVFGFTDPPVPPDWHGVSASEVTAKGTKIHIHP